MGLKLVCGVCLKPIDATVDSENFKGGLRICDSCNVSMTEEEVHAKARERMMNVVILPDHPIQ